jgi:HSP20 family protein
VAQFSFLPTGESRELTDDVRELFADLAAHLEHEQRAYSGECHPPLDVRETADAVEVMVDVSGIAPEAIRVLFRADVLLVAGEKAPVPGVEQQTYHLVEREFGRFARAVRVSGSFDIQRAHATVLNGELTVVLPKLMERRGRAHRIPVSADTAGTTRDGDSARGSAPPIGGAHRSPGRGQG